MQGAAANEKFSGVLYQKFIEQSVSASVVITVETGIQKFFNVWIPGRAARTKDPRLPGMTFKLCC